MLVSYKGRVQKPQERKFSAIRGGGVPPFSAKKKSVKYWPKNSVFKAKNAVFGELLAGRRPLRGGGVPPFSAKKFLLREVFKNPSNGNFPLRGGGGTPLFR